MITKIVSLKDYLELTKPGVQALLFISCVSGMLLASNFKPPLGVLFYGVLGISLLAASSAVINHIFDVFIDSKMSRTSSRPIVTGVISTKEASLFALLLFLTGSLLLFFYTNTLTLLLTSFTFIFYAFIYTKYLKFLTLKNTHHLKAASSPFSPPAQAPRTHRTDGPGTTSGWYACQKASFHSCSESDQGSRGSS